MADLFISYAKDDRERARRVAEALEKRGWRVWWDREIPPGRSFDEVIQEAIDEARCVVVLWSRHSVASNWVKTEAVEGASRNALVPAMLDAVKLPLEFRRIQAADLTDWDGDPAHPDHEREELLRELETLNQEDDARHNPKARSFMDKVKAFFA